ncbi:hypothetical protein RCL1_000938 [Eukaryota sp. TZLM3-RCL]
MLLITLYSLPRKYLILSFFALLFFITTLIFVTRYTSDWSEFLEITEGHYNSLLASNRNSLFPSLHNVCYLDYAAAGIVSSYQTKRINSKLSNSLFINPHSSGESSLLIIRNEILDFFNAKEDYHVIFSSGATSAIKILSDTFDFSDNSLFLYSTDNHVSILGIRSKLSRHQWKGVSINQIIMTAIDHNQFLESNQLFNVLNLLAIPHQSNFDGSIINFELIISQINSDCEKRGLLPWKLLLDSAGFVSSHHFDLQSFSTNQIDFIPISFYKMFGYPTGVGCLLVKKSSFSTLIQSNFGGGSVAFVAPQRNLIFRKSGEAGFELGTLSFADIEFLKFGLDFLKIMDMKKIENHSNYLTKYLRGKLSSLRHNNGLKLVQIHENQSNLIVSRGPITTFNLLDNTDKYFPPKTIATLALRQKIYLRTGALCNHGAFIENFNISESEIIQKFEKGCTCDPNYCLKDQQLNSNSEINSNKIENQINVNTNCFGDFYSNGIPMSGVMRVSIGIATTFQDLQIFLKFIRSFLNQSINDCNDRL